MKRFLAPLALSLIAGTTAQAQTITRTYSTSDGWGGTASNTQTTSVVGTIANQSVWGNVPNYAGYVPSYAGYSNPSYPTNNYVYAPTYNYNYGGGGYGYPTGYGSYPYPYGYGTTVVPAQTFSLGRSYYGWDTPPQVTVFPQTIPPLLGYSSSAVFPNGTIGFSTTTIAPNTVAPNTNPNRPNRSPSGRFNRRR